MEFPCGKCGLCCKNAKRLNDEIKSYFTTVPPELVFPHKINDNGSCSMLTEDGLCSVYDDRPLVCNIKKLGQKFNFDEKTWFKQNAQSCNTEQIKAGMDESFRVNI